MRRLPFISIWLLVALLLGGCSVIRTKFDKFSDGTESRDMLAWQFGTFRQNTFRSEQEDGRDIVEWTDEVEGRDTLIRLIDAAAVLGELAALRVPAAPPPLAESPSLNSGIDDLEAADTERARE